MAFVLQCPNHIEREEHNRTIASSVISTVTLPVSIETVLGDQCFEH
jgi:hypothetical protein